MKKVNTLLAAGAISLTAFNSVAAELEISVQNLTQGIYFTPILVAAHTPDASLYEVGMQASTELQMMAEGGDISGLSTVVTSVNGDIAAQEADAGLTSPAMTRTYTVSTADSNTALSIAAMLLPTNDAFVGLDNWAIPEAAGTYTLYLNAYDAGTEANDEIRGGGAPGIAGMPVPPPLEGLIGTGGSGVTTEESNATVHIHRGNLGDDDASSGTSDISSSVQRWLNPVAKVTVTVQ